MLSQAGKAIIIKSNLTEIPMFTMHYIKISNYIAKEIDCKNRDFFWHNNIEYNNIHSTIPLISWDKICRPKCECGLGIRRTQDVNAALLAKLGWKIIKDPDNLWTRVVSTKDLGKGDFLVIKKIPNSF